MVLIERGGNADDDGVHPLPAARNRKWQKIPAPWRFDFLPADAVDVGFTFGQRVDLALIDVEAGDAEISVR